MTESTLPSETGMIKTESSGLIRPVASTHELISAHKEWAKVVAEVLESGRDYGQIPGTEDKLTLLKPGAERLALAARLAAQYELLSEEIDHDRKVEWTKTSRKYGTKSGTSVGLYRYAVKCRLIQKTTGELVGEGVGAASSLESKYVERPRDVENTILKIAKKRAFVDAVLTTLALSDRFTQDVEDVEPAPPKTRPAGVPTEPPVVDAEIEEDASPAVIVSDKQLKMLWAKLYARFERGDVPKAKQELEHRFGLAKLDDLPADQFDAAVEYIARGMGIPR